MRNYHVSPNATSFYVTNFLDYIISSNLWRACNRIGKVVDVFISNNRSQLGKCFGFVRFSGECNNELMIKQLCDIWFGYHKVFAAIPRTPRLIKSAPSSQQVPPIFEKQHFPDNSYASIVKGSVNSQQNKIVNEEVLTLTSGDFVVENNK